MAQEIVEPDGCPVGQNLEMRCARSVVAWQGRVTPATRPSPNTISIKRACVSAGSVIYAEFGDRARQIIVHRLKPHGETAQQVDRLLVDGAAQGNRFGSQIGTP